MAVLIKKFLMSSSFRRARTSASNLAGPAVAATTGSRPLDSPSCGVPEIDVLLLPGGGIPFGSLLAIFCDRDHEFSNVFKTLFLAQGIIENQKTCLWYAKSSPEYLACTLASLWKALPNKRKRESLRSSSASSSFSSSSLSAGTVPNSAEKLNIAWRYQSINSSAAGDFATHSHFDLTFLTLKEEYANRQDLLVLQPLDPSASDFLDGLEKLPPSSRIVVDLSCTSVEWSPILALRFQRAKAIVERMKHIMLVLLPSEDLCLPSFRLQASYFSDILFSFEMIAVAFGPKDKTVGATSKKGFLKIKKPMAWKGRVSPFLPSTNYVWQLVLEKKHLFIEPFSIPPEAGEKVEDKKQSPATMACFSPTGSSNELF